VPPGRPAAYRRTDSHDLKGAAVNFNLRRRSPPSPIEHLRVWFELDDGEHRRGFDHQPARTIGLTGRRLRHRSENRTRFPLRAFFRCVFSACAVSVALARVVPGERENQAPRRPSAKTLWRTYPLNPAREGGVEARATNGDEAIAGLAAGARRRARPSELQRSRQVTKQGCRLR
jgi:hypothetical protein